MKLKKVTCIDPVARITFNLRASTQEQIEQYRKLYTQTFGDPISASQLIEELLRDVFAADREFQKFMAAQSPGKEPTHQ